MKSCRCAFVLAALVFAVAVATVAAAAERVMWLRYPAISPDGKTVAFSYHGNLWKVSADGGTASPLTMSDAYNTDPVWSPDGSKIAFASDRYGNFDVFVMPAEGGEARRLTFHSSDEMPTSFTPDGKSVLFSAAILDAASNVQFPTPAQPELYRVGLDGGMPVQVLTTPALFAAYDRAGKRLAYSDVKGYEHEWRKHDNSSFARDLWMFDVASGKHTQLTPAGFDNRQPVWAPGDGALYYLSEKSGSFNVWRMDLADPQHPVQVTTHTVNPVRFLSASSGGDLCYAYDGEIWVRRAGARDGKRLEVSIAADERNVEVKPVDVGSEVTEFEVSPDGSEIAFVAHGEVFVASTEHGMTRRITNTPEQERSVSFSPDGRSLLYASERGGRWRLYRTDLTDKDEPNFFNATALKETPVLESDAETFQPRFSPDGTEVAYLENRTELKVLNLKTGKSRTILPADLNYSYLDGDQWYEWSPDGKWFAVQFLSHTRWSSEVGLIPSSGEGKLVNVTNSGYEDEVPHWASKGEVLFWLTDRQGLRSQAGNGREQDVYAAFLTTKAWDRYRLDEAAFDQLKAKEKDKDKAKDKAADKDKAAEKGKEKAVEEPKGAKLPPPVAIEFDKLDDRIVRLSLHSADLAGAALSPDGETLYYLAKFEKGFDLWKYVPRKKEVKLVAKLDAKEASFALEGDGKKAFVLADNRLSTVDVESGKTSPVKASARMELHPAAERAYLFEHAWRQTYEKFLVADMHGVDWKAMKANYARFLPYIDNDRDFAELISELQGELNASHTGGRFRPTRNDGDATAALGFFPDPKHAGDGVGILEVIEGGPLEKEGTRIKAGVVIEAIDGAKIAAGANWYPLLNRKADTPVRLALFDPKAATRWEETVKPISWMAQSRLLYQRWVRSRRDEVEKLSGGRLGYAHIRGMNDGAYREIYEEIFGRAVDKEGIVLDTRWNGGGNLVEALTVFLTGKVYAHNVPRGREVGVEPSGRWTKPSVVVMNEGNYSDAHCFPMAYTQLGIGDTVGMPVPGTCTSVWWERLQDRDLVFGIPEVGLVDMQGDLMENKHLAPTYQVPPDPALVAAGRDQQLEKAVEVLLAKLPKR
ncbi:MAG TPA: LpqB family beta-propeller domain-containing protein [Thermoanaerobaculaceae bacterium]|nr:LpqB family beta-propeller domain-containing protein [Thermoanaerobaculaceae bacterium]